MRASRGGTVGLALPAAVDDQAAVMKSVETDPRPGTAAGETGEFGRPWIIESGEFQDGRATASES